MFQTIVLCTDGSSPALNAARLTVDLACRQNACVDLVHVLDPIVAAGAAGFVPEAGVSAEITLEYAEEGQQAVLNCTAEILERAHVSCTPHAEFGHPVESIHKLAEQRKADLIIIGSRGLSAWPALLLGSVSDGITQHASCPVLVIRGEPTGFQKIVIASDGSEGALHALRAGMELAQDYHADVSILNVFQPQAVYQGMPRGDSSPGDYAARVKDAICATVDPIAKENGVSFRLCQEEGHPAETLVRFAEKNQADLIVVGTRGLGGFQRLLLGSVSRSVLHHAQCSVLVVR